MPPPTTTAAARSGAAAASASSPAPASTRTSALAAATAAGPIPPAPGVTPLRPLRFRRPALGGLATRARRRRHSVDCTVGRAVAPGIAHTGGPRRRRGDLNHTSRTGAGEQRPLRDPQPWTDAHHRGRSGEAVREYQTAARAAAPPLRPVNEQTAAVVARTTVDDEAAREDERPIGVRPVEERIVEARAAEGVVEEGIVARAVGAVAIVGPAVPIAVAEAPPHAERRVVVIVARVVRLRVRDGVVRHVVVEVAVGRHALHHVEQRLLLVVPRLARAQ